MRIYHRIEFDNRETTKGYKKIDAKKNIDSLYSVHGEYSFRLQQSFGQLV
jgi:hypothetical protein